VSPRTLRDTAALPGAGLGLAGRSVLVSGALGSVGRAVVAALAAAGASVFGVDRATRPGTLAGCDGLSAADVTDPAEMADLLADIKRQAGHLDGLVNNAAVLEPRDLTYSLAAAQFRERLTNNVEAVYVPSRVCSSVLAGRPGAAIVNVSSVCGTRAFRGSAGYVASKGAVEALTRALALELAPAGIRVNAVAPAMIVSSGWSGVDEPEWRRRSRLIPLGRPAEPMEIANVIAFLLSPLSSYVTGQTLIIDGGLTIGSYSPDAEEAFIAPVQEE